MDDTTQVRQIDKTVAAELVIKHHYLHRKPPMSFAYGLSKSNGEIVGVCTFGVPASRHLQISACRTNPSQVMELNRLWVADAEPRNTESWFVAQCLAKLPPFIVVSYADLAQGHIGYIYRALNFKYAGWTDMDRKTPRFDYIPIDSSQHTRNAFRTGYKNRQRRQPKVRYWITTGNRQQRQHLLSQCTWPILDWHVTPPPSPAS